MERFPRHELAHYTLGLTYLDQARYADAVRSFQRVLELNRTSADAHYELGLASRGQSDENKAEQEFREALKYNPNLGEARQALERRHTP